MIYLFYTIHIITSIFLILVVLLQQGKGADLSVFGGGATQTAFGARGATQIVHKLTVAFFGLFIVTTLGIGLLQGHATGSTVMTDDPVVETEPAVTPAEPSVEPAAPALAVPEATTPAGEGGAAAPAGETTAPAAEAAPAEPAPAEQPNP